MAWTWAQGWPGGSSAGSAPAASLLLAVAGVAMGGPLVISTIPAEAVATGEVGRALAVPIVAAEVLGGAALPATAAAIAPQVGLPGAVGIVATGLVVSVVLALAIRPTADDPA